MLKKFIIAFAGFALVAISLGAIKAAQIKEMTSAPHVIPPTAVATAKAESVAWNTVINAIGTLAPVQGVTISAEAEGTVVKIGIENGSAVKAGDLLVELDTTVEVAQLAAAESRAELARLQRDRADELLKKNTISQAEFDAAVAQSNQADAEVAAIRAQIEKKRVRAPFDGRAGIRQVNLGQFVSRGTPLIPLQKLDPIYVNFSVPQRQLAALALGQDVAVAVDGFERAFPGKLTAINAEVDATTRNIALQATIANPQEALRAGMFARVEVQLPATESYVVVPATAIAYASYGNSVFVVETLKDPSGKEYLGVRQQFVKLGQRRGDLVSVTGGLKPGEEVVTAGVFKLRNGGAVQVNNSAQPSSNAAPKPANT